MDGNETSAVLPSAWIERLFSRFRAIYGNRVETMWREADPREVQSVWGESLGRYEAVDIKRALETMVLAYADYPPTLPQFTSMCRDARNARTQQAAKLTHVRYNPVAPEVLAAIHELTRDPVNRKRDPKDWARRILARESAGEKLPIIALTSAREALGL